MVVTDGDLRLDLATAGKEQWLQLLCQIRKRVISDQIWLKELEGEYLRRFGGDQ
jgi:hypothetical protein